MAKESKTKLKISYKSMIQKIEGMRIVRLPMAASSKLGSRGIVLAEAEINDKVFTAALETDGLGSHWFEAGKSIYQKIKIGEAVDVSIQPLQERPDPKLPLKFRALLKGNTLKMCGGGAITTKAKWEWVRWIGSSKNPEIRRKRINTAFSMLNAGKKDHVALTAVNMLCRKCQKTGCLTSIWGWVKILGIPGRHMCLERCLTRLRFLSGFDIILKYGQH